ncbi:hypothetical protein RI129_011098 [Pyrocoelia pectoralis]|uniref:Uncharacterized protein n=1 Tax=Pyrocoelia pectoralis TaxID=417401 RepID=A0AAN7V3D4_9COLE
MSLKSRTFLGLSKLSNLQLSSNLKNIDTQAFNGLSYLEVLQVQSASLADLNQYSFTGLANLKKLHFIETTFGSINPNAFDGLTNLNSLRFDNCTIGTLKKGAFAGLSSIRYINVHNHQSCSDVTFYHRYLYNFCNMGLKVIESGAFSQIRTVDAKNFPGMMAELNLNDNQLSVIVTNNFIGMEHLKRLALAYNNITTLQPEAFGTLNNLEVLNLTHNTISELNTESFKGLPHLLYLDLGNNRLSSLNIQMLAPLRVVRNLDISGNALTELISLGTLPIKTLNLSRNKLTMIRDGTLESLTQLQVLNLSHNALTTFHYSIPTLNSLYINSNNLRSFNSELLPKLETVDFTDNQIACNDLPNILESLKNHSASYVTEVNCVYDNFDKDSTQMENRMSILLQDVKRALATPSNFAQLNTFQILLITVFLVICATQLALVIKYCFIKKRRGPKRLPPIELLDSGRTRLITV